MTILKKYIGDGYVGEMPVGFVRTTDAGFIGHKSTPFNNFLHAGGNRTGVFLEFPEDCFIYQVGLKVRSSSNPANECKVALYDKIGLTNANNLVVSPDSVPFGTSLQTLLFSFNYEPAYFGKEKFMVMQCLDDYYFEYDNVSTPEYGYFGNGGYGNWDATPSGIAIFNNILTMWIDYVTIIPSVGTVKKRLLLTGVGK